MASTPLGNIIWESALKQKILSHARAVFIGPVRPGTVFDVVTTTRDLMKEVQNHTGYVAHLIALDELSPSEKLKILVTTDRHSTEKECLDALARNLQGRLSNMIGELYCDISGVSC